MDALLLLVLGGLHVLLNIRIHAEERASDDINNDICLTNVNQHVVFQNLCKLSLNMHLQLALPNVRKRHNLHPDP